MLDFTYDESGHPLTMRRYFNEAQSNYCTYHYILNAQGDVVKLMYGANKTVAEYSYDAWGNLLNISGADLSVAKLNPLRYRGYYCDSETGFYYLESRYYDPIVRRFLNTDAFVSTGQGILGYNMFAYCNNNPVIFSDPSGHMMVCADRDLCGGGTKKKTTPMPNPASSYLLQNYYSGPTIQPAYTGPVAAPRNYTTYVDDFDAFPYLSKSFDLIGSSGTELFMMSMNKGVVGSSKAATKYLAETARMGKSFSAYFGTFAIACDVGGNLYNNIYDGAPATKVICDFAGDTISATASMWVAGTVTTTLTAAGATFGTCLCPGVGTAVCAGIGCLCGWAADIVIDSVWDWIF